MRAEGDPPPTDLVESVQQGIGNGKRNSGSSQVFLIGISADHAPVIAIVNDDLGLDHGARTRKLRLRGPALRTATPAAAQDSVGQLPRALEILAVSMRETIEERRASPSGSDRHRRADERVAYLNELYGHLQRRMTIPREVWLLGKRTARGRRR